MPVGVHLDREERSCCISTRIWTSPSWCSLQSCLRCAQACLPDPAVVCCAAEPVWRRSRLGPGSPPSCGSSSLLGTRQARLYERRFTSVGYVGLFLVFSSHAQSVVGLCQALNGAVSSASTRLISRCCCYAPMSSLVTLATFFQRPPPTLLLLLLLLLLQPCHEVLTQGSFTSPTSSHTCPLW